MIAIVDYNVGNLFSLASSLSALGVDCVVTNDHKIIENADKVILPGVGAFFDAIKSLRDKGLEEVVLREIDKGKPVMGICLGMQLLYKESFEYGIHEGLGLINGQITDLSGKLDGQNLKVPHMGWNNLVFSEAHPLLKYVKNGDFVYYVHSYFAEVSEHTLAYSEYGTAKITGIVVKDNVFGTQFHPEKSGNVGLSILKAFNEIK